MIVKCLHLVRHAIIGVFLNYDIVHIDFTQFSALFACAVFVHSLSSN